MVRSTLPIEPIVAQPKRGNCGVFSLELSADFLLPHIERTTAPLELLGLSSVKLKMSLREMPNARPLSLLRRPAPGRRTAGARPSLSRHPPLPRTAGLPGRLLPVGGADHFTILDAPAGGRPDASASGDARPLVAGGLADPLRDAAMALAADQHRLHRPATIVTSLSRRSRPRHARSLSTLDFLAPHLQREPLFLGRRQFLTRGG
jgi:hypothetical protein